MDDLLNVLKNFNYGSLSPFQRELMQRNIVRFVLDLMKAEKNNKTPYLEILWQTPASSYHERDKERLSYLEPKISKLFNLAKFSRNKVSVLPLAEEIGKYYQLHEGKLDLLFLEIFKSAWDYDFEELKKLFFTREHLLEDLSFLFVMSIDKEKLDPGFYKRLSETNCFYPRLVGRAVLIEKFKEAEEVLSDRDVKAIGDAYIFRNKNRPIVSFYKGLVNRLTPEQINSCSYKKELVFC
jgi:hypothetical protein